MKEFRGSKGKKKKHYNYNLKKNQGKNLKVKKLKKKLKQMLLLEAVASVGDTWSFSSQAVILGGVRLWSTPTDQGLQSRKESWCNGLLDPLDKPIVKRC